MTNTNDNSAADLMNEVVQHTRALDHSFATWDETKDRRAAADALRRARLLELRLRKLRDRLTEDVQAYDREHDPHDPEGLTMRAAVLALAILLTAQGCPAEEPQKPQPTQRCEEDDPCWDCHENGNKKCGPGAGVVLAVKHSPDSTDNQ